MAAELGRRPSRLAAWWDSDLCWSFRHTPSAIRVLARSAYSGLAMACSNDL